MVTVRSVAISLMRLAVLTAIVVVLFLLQFQHGLIYHPRPYRTTEIAHYTQVVDLPFSTSQGNQHCYYVPPRSQEVAGRRQGHMWVVFCGNGSRALDWMELIPSYSSEDDAYLLEEYPGYGASAGSASPQTIQENAEASLQALSRHLSTPVAAFEGRLGVLGHSLGAAAALRFADVHPVSQIVLIAPFTSLRDMARRTVGWPLCYLLLGNFDNRVRLQEITHRSQVPRITIFSGTADEVIPFRMGQELASLFPRVDFEPVEGSGHNDILFNAQDRIRTAMAVTGL